MDSKANGLKPANAIPSLVRRSAQLPPADYPDSLINDLSGELSGFLSSDEILLLDKLYSVVQYDYRNKGLIGKGYHCLEHSLEVAVLLLKARRHSNHSPVSAPEKSFSFEPDRNELLELTVAALLHDYDPHSLGEPPRVERTLHILKTDEIIKDILERLHLNIFKIGLLIERTDFPFTIGKEMAWEGEVQFYFNNEADRKRFEASAEMLALIDKGSPYYYLTPEEAHKRVEALAEEMRFPKELLLSNTYNFFVKENVSRLSLRLPEKYHQRWLLVERHFLALAQTIPQEEKIAIKKRNYSR